jgi:hypothetical protein
VITGDGTLLSLASTLVNRPGSVCPKGKTVIEHRGGDIPLFVKSSGFPIEIQTVGVSGSMRTLKLKGSELQLTGSSGLVIDRVAASSNGSIRGTCGSVQFTNG